MKLIEYGYKKVDIDTYDTIIRKKNYEDQMTRLSREYAAVLRNGLVGRRTVFE